MTSELAKSLLSILERATLHIQGGEVPVFMQAIHELVAVASPDLAVATPSTDPRPADEQQGGGRRECCEQGSVS